MELRSRFYSTGGSLRQRDVDMILARCPETPQGLETRKEIESLLSHAVGLVLTQDAGLKVVDHIEDMLAKSNTHDC